MVMTKMIIAVINRNKELMQTILALVVLLHKNKVTENFNNDRKVKGSETENNQHEKKICKESIR